MPTTVSVAAGHGVTTHKISLKGLAGAILYCLVIALVFALIAFVTEGWAQVNTESGGVRIGLWMTCLCKPNLVAFTVESWFRGSQALITIGFVCLGISTFSGSIYAFVHNFNKNRVLKLVLLCSSLTVVFMVSGLVVFGLYTISYRAMQGFSYVFTLITCILCVSASILSCVQLHRSRTMECCGCCKCCGDSVD